MLSAQYGQYGYWNTALSSPGTQPRSCLNVSRSKSLCKAARSDPSVSQMASLIQPLPTNVRDRRSHPENWDADSLD
ncbi:unnamed protein product [Boreogadus saida]